MLTHFDLKLLIVLLSAALLLILRAWLQSEKDNAWAYREFHKQARLPNRYPKPSALRKILIQLFNIKYTK